MADGFLDHLNSTQRPVHPESRFGLLNENGEKKKPVSRYDCHVFVIFRPWNECSRCMTAIKGRRKDDGSWAAPTLELEGEADYQCPHVQKTEYKNLVNQHGAGKLQIISRSNETLKNGTIQVFVEWLTKETP